MISSRFFESSILQVDGLDQSIDPVAFEEIPNIKAIKKYNLSNKTSIIMSYCISTNIADVLQAAGIKSKILASPAEDAILDLI